MIIFGEDVSQIPERVCSSPSQVSGGSIQKMEIGRMCRDEAESPLYLLIGSNWSIRCIATKDLLVIAREEDHVVGYGSAAFHSWRADRHAWNGKTDRIGFFGK
jgi:hypothetical protein